jgi:mono/diheme cytochrome c family protein
VSKRKTGNRWIWIAGFALWLGCSEEVVRSPANSSDSGAKDSAIDAPIAAPGTATSSPVEDNSETAPKSLSPEELIAAGRSAYNANCIACHSMDPTQDGALGPAVSGASLELLEARVLRVEYPDGYVPKRTTRVMVPLPHLEPRLVELAAYLESLE